MCSRCVAATRRQSKLRAIREMVQVSKGQLPGGADHTEMVRVVEQWAGGADAGAELRDRSK